jgi:hypothetical protein
MTSLTRVCSSPSLWFCTVKSQKSPQCSSLLLCLLICRRFGDLSDNRPSRPLWGPLHAFQSGFLRWFLRGQRRELSHLDLTSPGWTIVWSFPWSFSQIKFRRILLTNTTARCCAKGKDPRLSDIAKDYTGCCVQWSNLGKDSNRGQRREAFLLLL